MSLEQQQLIEAISLSPIPMVVSNPRRPDNPLELINTAFCSLTGYPPDEILGRNCRFLAGEATDEIATDQIREGLRERRPVLVEIVNYRRDGTGFRNGVMIAPLFGEDGELCWFLGSQVDLGEIDNKALARRRSDAAGRIALLSKRQRQVLERMALGLLNKQIAWDLKITEKTVKMHRSLLLDALGVASSAEAIRLAVEAGL